MMKTAGRFRRTVAVLMAAVMVIGMMPAMAFAEEAGGDKVNVVVFGNSTSSGYGMPDFYNRNNGFGTLNNYLEQWAADEDGFTPEGWAAEKLGDTSDWTEETIWSLKAAEDYARGHSSLSRMSNYAFPWQLKKYISQQEGKKVDLVPFTLNGMRTDEFRAFLDKDYYEKSVARELAYAERFIQERGITTDQDSYRSGFMKAHMDWYAGNFYDNKETSDRTYDTAAAYVKKNIQDADVIVLDLCGNNFGTYVGYRLNAFLGNANRYSSNTYETIADVEDLPENIRNSIMKVKETLISQVGALDSPAVSQLLDAYLYGAADCIVNFAADVEMVHQINPDAKVIVVGLNNPMLGLKIKAGSTEVDFGAVLGRLYQMINLYVKALDRNNDNYYYADIPMDLTTFASTIADAESLEALLSDGEIEDGRGAYAIDRIYREFINDFMGGADGDAKTVYSMIQSAVIDGMPKDLVSASLKGWNELGEDEQIGVRATSYLTADPEKLAAAASQEELFGAFSISANAPEKANYFTKESVRVVAAKYKMLTLTDAEKEQLTQAAVAAGITEPEAVTQFIYEYIYDQVKDNEEALSQAYGMIQAGLKSQDGLQNANGFSELSDDECVTFQSLGDVKLFFDPEAASIGEAVALTGTVPLNKAVIRQITAAKVKPAIEKMLYEALHEHGTIDVAALQESLADMDRTADAIASYMSAVIMGDEDAKLDEAYWGLLVIEERFLLSDGVGEHPSAVGCTQKYQGVLDAYLSETTAAGEVKEAIRAKIDELYARMIEIADEIGRKAGYSGIEQLIEEMSRIMEQLKVIGIAIYQLPEYEKTIDEYAETLAEFSAEIADLQDMVDGMGAQSAELSSQIEKLEEEASGLRAQLAEMQEKNKALEDQAKLNEDEIERLNAIIREMEESMTALEFAQKKVSLKKVKAAKKSFTAAWKSLGGAEGYQVSYKLGKKTVKKTAAAAKTSLKVKKLKKGKKYTVKVRAYRTIGGKKIYSKWSSGKKVKVK